MSNSPNLPSWLHGADLLDEPPAAPTPPPPTRADNSARDEERRKAYTDYIVRQLGRNVPPAEVMMTLVEKYSCPWAEAERLVSHVSIHHRRDIQGRQRPLMIVITLGTLLGGIILLGYGVMRINEGYMNRGILNTLVLGAMLLLGGFAGIFQLLREMAGG